MTGFAHFIIGFLVGGCLITFPAMLFIYTDFEHQNKKLRLKADEYKDGFNDLVVRYNLLVRKNNGLIDKYNLLIDSEKSKSLSNDEIRKLLSLCHPDKHGGKPLANEMTERLLLMRGK